MDLNPNDPRHAELINLRSANQQRIQEFAAQGISISIDRTSWLIQALADLDVITTADAVDIELRYHQELDGTLDQVDTERRRQALVAGITPPGAPVLQLHPGGNGIAG